MFSFMPFRPCFPIRVTHVLSLILLALLAPAAHAGHWQFSAAGSTDASTVHVEGVILTQTPSPPPWAPPTAPSDRALTLSLPGASATDTNYGHDPSCDFTVNASVHITATWVSDTTSDNTPPPSVWLCENATASWEAGPGVGQTTGGGLGTPGQPPPPPISPVFTYTGNAANGLSDPYVPSPLTGPSTSGSSTLSTTQTLPPDGWHKYTVTGGAVTLPVRSLVATATATVNTPGMVSITGALTYSITVHAQPYNYHRVPGQSVKGNDGTIGWTYGYSSTSGNTSDLTSCYWHEYLTYQGPVGTVALPNKYYPPDPPFDYPAGGSYFNNPDVFPGPGTQGNLMAQTQANAMEYDITKVPDFVAPSLYTFGTFTSTQVYQFDDTQTGETNVSIPGPDSGPFSTVRTVQYLDANDYQYSVTKNSVTNTKLLPD